MATLYIVYASFAAVLAVSRGLTKLAEYHEDRLEAQFAIELLRNLFQ